MFEIERGRQNGTCGRQRVDQVAVASNRTACEKAGVAAATRLERPNASIPLFHTSSAGKLRQHQGSSSHASPFRGRWSPRGMTDLSTRVVNGLLSRNEVKSPKSRLKRAPAGASTQEVAPANHSPIVVERLRFNTRLYTFNTQLFCITTIISTATSPTNTSSSTSSSTARAPWNLSTEKAPPTLWSRCRKPIYFPAPSSATFLDNPCPGTRVKPPKEVGSRAAPDTLLELIRACKATC